MLGLRLLEGSSGNVEAMVEEGFLACLSRFPDAREREILVRLFHEQRAYFEGHPTEATALLGAGQAKVKASLPVADAAAAAVLAQALLNHDGCVVKQ